MSVFELFRSDIFSKNSHLLSNPQIENIHDRIFEILLYGISGRES